MATEKRYTVAGRRKLYTLAEALARAGEVFTRTGIIVAVEESRKKAEG